MKKLAGWLPIIALVTTSAARADETPKPPEATPGAPATPAAPRTLTTKPQPLTHVGGAKWDPTPCRADQPR